MIDLHSHILPLLDDGANGLAESIEMARMAVADGTVYLACTPHMTAGIYDNSAKTILPSCHALQEELNRLEIPLHLVSGADYHIESNMVERLASGDAPTLAGTRYFLFEPPHQIMPPGLGGLARTLIAAGFSPLLTHPERLSWIERHYDEICDMNDDGVAIQLTAASITGEFGKRAQYWSQRMIEENRVAIIASDAHDTQRRPPGLSRARDEIAARYGDVVATNLVTLNPARILRNEVLPAGGSAEFHDMPAVSKETFTQASM